MEDTKKCNRNIAYCVYFVFSYANAIFIQLIRKFEIYIYLFWNFNADINAE